MPASADLSANTLELVAPTQRDSDAVAAVDNSNRRIPKNHCCCLLWGGGLQQDPSAAPSVVGIGMFGFTLSWDEIARTSQAIGDVNTLPLELQGLTTTVTNPAIYALGTLTTMVSFVVIGVTTAVAMRFARKRK